MQNLIEDKRYYIYFHVDPRNGEIIYVGKGYDYRAWNFDGGRNQWHKNKLNKLLSLDYTKDDIIQIYQKNLNEDKAFEIEEKLIKEYGRKDLGEGNLLNFTNGGEGNSGILHDKKSRKKLSESKKEYFKYNEHHNKGKNWSEETKKKISESIKEWYKYNNAPMKNRKKTKEQIENNRKALKEYYKHHDGPMKGKKHTEETKQKIGNVHREMWKKYEHPLKNKDKTQEHKQKLSESKKNLFQNNPEIVKSMKQTKLNKRPYNYKIKYKNGLEIIIEDLVEWCKENKFNYKSVRNYVDSKKPYKNEFFINKLYKKVNLV